MEYNPEDVVSVDVPLLIRLLEYSKEDAKTDADLHELADRLVSLSSMGKTLTMDDYEQLVPQQDPDVKRMIELSGMHKY